MKTPGQISTNEQSALFPNFFLTQCYVSKMRKDLGSILAGLRSHI